MVDGEGPFNFQLSAFISYDAVTAADLYIIVASPPKRTRHHYVLEMLLVRLGSMAVLV